MVTLIFNEVVRVDSDGLRGVFRVLCASAGRPTVWLAYVAPLPTSETGSYLPTRVPGALIQVATDTLAALSESGQMAAIDLKLPGKLLVPTDLLEDSEQVLAVSRNRLMKPFFDADRLAQALDKTKSIGPLVSEALATNEGNRSTVYRMWRLLCQFGFHFSSLSPRFERCGAPGVPRPHREGMKKVGRKPALERLQEPIVFPQRPVTEADRTKILFHAQALSRPGLPFLELYDQIISRVYVTDYEQTPDGLKGVLPAQGTYPNRRQVRHIIDSVHTPPVSDHL